MTRRLTGSSAAEAAAGVAADPALLEEARALLPQLQAEVAPAGEQGVRQALQPLFALYPQPERSAAEWTIWWAHYIEDLSGFCPQSLAAAVRAYRRLPGSRFMPLPGELAALARSADVPAISRLGRVREAIRLANLPPDSAQRMRGGSTGDPKGGAQRQPGVGGRAPQTSPDHPTQPSPDPAP